MLLTDLRGVRSLTSSGIRHQGVPQRISTTLWNTSGEGRLLVLGRLGNLILLEVTNKELGVEIVKLDTVDNVKRVDDVS